VVELTLEFSATQSLSALQATLYRLIGTAVGTIDQIDDKWVCKLEVVPAVLKKNPLDAAALRIRFLELLADENLRETIASKTAPVRNLMLALAFGSLAKNSN
jgi:His-Xaa-Ser system protein HxsD